MLMLAFTPLFDPLPALYPGMSDQWLWMVIPLVVAISLVYKGTRVEQMKDIWKESFIMSAQMMIVMVAAGLILAGGYWAYLRISG